MNNIYISSLLAFLVSSITLGQNTEMLLGYYHDVSGDEIEGVYGPNYQPYFSFNKNFIEGDVYTQGKYYDNNDSIHEGYIKYNPRNSSFRFKHENDSETFGIKIKPSHCKSYTIGLDSFIRISNFAVQRDLGPFMSHKPDFAQIILEFDSISYLKHFHMNQNRILITNIVKDKNGLLESLPKAGTKLKEAYLKHFGSIPLLKNKILNTTAHRNSFENYIIIAYYYHKHQNSEPIYYDYNWNRLTQPENAYYYSTTEEFNDEFIKLNYFHLDGTPIYSASYSSLFPKIINEDLERYHPDGSIWKKEYYSRYKLADSIKTYYPDGSLHSVKHIDPNFFDRHYNVQIYSTEGDELLDSSGEGKEVFYDPILKRTLYKEYKYGLIYGSYYLSDSTKIYTSCSKPIKIINKSVKNSEFRASAAYPEEALKNNMEWNSLVKFIVKPDGHIQSFEIISKPNQIFDPFIVDYIKSISSHYKYFTKPKHNREKVYQEVVLPISFTISGYTRTRSNSFWLFHTYTNSFNSIDFPTNYLMTPMPF